MPCHWYQHSQFLRCQCIWSKLSKFSIFSYSETVSGNLSKNGCVWAAQWLTSSELKIKFDPPFDRSWCEFFKVIKDHDPKSPSPGCNFGCLFSFPSSKKSAQCSVHLYSSPWVVADRNHRWPIGTPWEDFFIFVVVGTYFSRHLHAIVLPADRPVQSSFWQKMSLVKNKKYPGELKQFKPTWFKHCKSSLIQNSIIRF